MTACGSHEASLADCPRSKPHCLMSLQSREGCTMGNERVQIIEYSRVALDVAGHRRISEV